jgi:hypothetical protein
MMVLDHLAALMRHDHDDHVKKGINMMSELTTESDGPSNWRATEQMPTSPG